MFPGAITICIPMMKIFRRGLRVFSSAKFESRGIWTEKNRLLKNFL
jgi:hypothetical protein